MQKRATGRVRTRRLASPRKIGFGLALRTLRPLIPLNKLALICRFYFSGAARSGSRFSGISEPAFRASSTNLAFFPKAKPVMVLNRRASLASFRNFTTPASPAGAAAHGTRLWAKARHAHELRIGLNKGERYLRLCQVRASSIVDEFPSAATPPWRWATSILDPIDIKTSVSLCFDACERP